jgi:hypothetical protein
VGCEIIWGVRPGSGARMDESQPVFDGMTSTTLGALFTVLGMDLRDGALR